MAVRTTIVFPVQLDGYHGQGASHIDISFPFGFEATVSGYVALAWLYAPDTPSYVLGTIIEYTQNGVQQQLDQPGFYEFSNVSEVQLYAYALQSYAQFVWVTEFYE